jgi:hypothetical protein
MNLPHSIATVMPTRTSPEFFRRIQEQSRRRWEQLEADPELAGPWRQLFSQVQSPRHIVSELLQNADDAGARSVHVGVHNGEFFFEHDGADFSAADFESLCRFGFSNKRNLHTIGFRGVGFKSTFSLGPAVHVLTPSLAVEFRKQRFTEPVWLANAAPSSSTSIRVVIEDANRARELQKNLDEWRRSAVSLLFFNNIERLQIEDTVLRRESLGPGPIQHSERIRLLAECDHELLIVRSLDEAFPDDVVREIREERQSSDITLPPCRVEIVIGLPDHQRLYVVLPTGVEPSLPFSCNAPFLQDPARFGIKDPAVSPTNRWLLDRIGALAADAMLDWLDRRSIPAFERAEAYQLLPKVSTQDSGLNGDVAKLVKEKFKEKADDGPVLLLADESLALPGFGVAPPRKLYEVWTPEQLVDFLGNPRAHLLSPHVSAEGQERLEDWGWLTIVRGPEIIERLSQNPRPRRPLTSLDLAQLWQFADETINRWDNATRNRVRIIPVEGKDRLFGAEEVVRLAAGRSRTAAGKSLADDADRQFLAGLLTMVDQDWIEFVNQLSSEKRPQGITERAAKVVLNLLTTIRLDSPSSWEKVINQAAVCIFALDEVETEQAVRLAHIAAALNIQVTPEFMFVTQDDCCRQAKDGLLCDLDRTVSSLFPKDWAIRHVIVDAYSQPSSSCTRDQWRSWVASEKSRLSQFAPLASSSEQIWGEERLRGFVQRHVGRMPSSFHYKGRNFQLKDIDFDRSLVKQWEEQAASDPNIWASVLRHILQGRKDFWANATTVEVRDLGYSNSYLLDCGELIASWIVRFQRLKCLPDTYGVLRSPAELLLRTPETEPLMGVESFVDADLDSEDTKPLLKLLGVRDTATGPERLLDRIRALAKSPVPLTQEVYKWYDALDRVAARARPKELAQLREAFEKERLILTDQVEWATSAEIFQRAGEDDLPDVPTVHQSCSDFSLWGRVGVAARPSPELVIDWLRNLPSGEKLDAQQQKRARAYLQRLGSRVWNECNHWLALDGKWSPVSDFDHGLRSGANLRVAELFPRVKNRTADLRMLADAIAENQPFSDVADLAAIVEYKLADRLLYLPRSLQKDWLQALAEGLSRVRMENDEQTAHIRSVAVRLSTTTWQPFHKIRVVPYIDSTPIGEPHSPEVLWHEQTLYVQDRQIVQLIKPLVEELSRPFGVAVVTDAIKMCVERPKSFVDEYLDCNFEMEELAAVTTSAPEELAADEETTQKASAIVDTELNPTTATTVIEPDGHEPIEDNLLEETESDEPSDGEPALVASEGGQPAEEDGQQSDEESPETSQPHELADDSEPVVAGPEASANGEPSKPSERWPGGQHHREHDTSGGNSKPGSEPHRGARDRTSRTESKPVLIARFAAASGFTWDVSRGLYANSQGATLRKAHAPLDWERWSSQGKCECRYWLSEQCLTRGIEVPADVWELIRTAPARYSMILEDLDGKAVEHPGMILIKLIDTEALGLFPAKYRIRPIKS